MRKWESPTLHTELTSENNIGLVGIIRFSDTSPQYKDVEND